MTAGSGLFLRGLDELMAEASANRGVLAVLDAATALHCKIADAAYRASVGVPPTHYSHCPCGAVMEIHGELDADDLDAIRDWNADHEACGDES